ncbi:MAG: lysine--tRNA ligase, partial [Candidatus Levybacteria bacterium]|nr:lysine--tRNA ligase [Candidatus Levybacteria bacterium]
MFWADKLLGDVTGKQVINDSWTPSGMVHMGSLKGPVIHDTLYRILKEKGIDVTFLYGFDDADPIDGLPSELQKSHSQYLGMPLFKAPSPDENGSFGDYFGNKMKALLDELEIKPDRLYKTSELYKNGTFNKAISFVLDHVQEIRKVYENMYKKTIPQTWYPLQVICPNCGKLGTTKVIGWNGEDVTFNCELNLVKWAQGCGNTGILNPLDGNSKMPWKVEWAAKWWTFGVTIESAGKDHGSAGGSYDVAMNIVKDVFKAKPPLKLVYEFFLSGGKKMSSSKGLGLTGEELLELMPPQVVRFFMTWTKPSIATEFDPNNPSSIYKIFDLYFWSGQDAKIDKEEIKNVPIVKAYNFAQIDNVEKVLPIRFIDLVSLMQMPNRKDEIREKRLEEWVPYAEKWLEKFAPESDKFIVRKQIPEQVKSLSENQKQFLKKISGELDKEWDAEELQTELYEWAKEINISSKDAFAAIYIALIGKDHGPKAAWLILSLDKEFVKKRFEEVSSSVILNSFQNLNEMPKLVRHDK